jgi:hypothetical protein
MISWGFTFIFDASTHPVDGITQLLLFMALRQCQQQQQRRLLGLRRSL